jgi:hypothetical protein
MSDDEFSLHRVPREDIAQGWVCLGDRRVHDQLRRRRLIAKVTQTANRKAGSAFCEMIYAKNDPIRASSNYPVRTSKNRPIRTCSFL